LGSFIAGLPKMRFTSMQSAIALRFASHPALDGPQAYPVAAFRRNQSPAKW
jgi:hypothetical protein